MHADDPAALDGVVDVGDVLVEPEHGALGHRLEVPAHGDAVDEVGVLEPHRRLDAQDGARHGRGLAGAGGEDHLPALAEVDGDVGVEGQPPVRQAVRVRDGVPHRLHGIGQVPLEADDPAIGGALQRAVGGRGDLGHSGSFAVGRIGSVVARRCRSSESSRLAHSRR